MVSVHVSIHVSVCFETVGQCSFVVYILGSFQVCGCLSIVIEVSWPENQGILFFIIFLKHWK